MNVIVTLDNRGGMCFNRRRQSRDRVLNERILALAGGRLLVSSFSARLFEGQSGVLVSDSFLSDAGEEDFCFVENEHLSAYADRIRKLIVYRWNRDYPGDFFLDLDLSARKLISSSEFAGSSHPVITEEIYE